MPHFLKPRVVEAKTICHDNESLIKLHVTLHNIKGTLKFIPKGMQGDDSAMKKRIQVNLVQYKFHASSTIINGALNFIPKGVQHDQGTMGNNIHVKELPMLVLNNSQLHRRSRGRYDSTLREFNRMRVLLRTTYTLSKPSFTP